MYEMGVVAEQWMYETALSSLVPFVCNISACELKQHSFFSKTVAQMWSLLVHRMNSTRFQVFSIKMSIHLLYLNSYYSVLHLWNLFYHSDHLFYVTHCIYVCFFFFLANSNSKFKRISLFQPAHVTKGPLWLHLFRRSVPSAVSTGPWAEIYLQEGTCEWS